MGKVQISDSVRGGVYQKGNITLSESVASQRLTRVPVFALIQSFTNTPSTAVRTPPPVAVETSGPCNPH